VKPLIFKLIRQPEIEVDLSPLTPDAMAGRTLAEIRRLPLAAPGQSLCVGDLFEVTGGDRQYIQIRRCSSRVKHIGRGMLQGSIEVHGHAGDYLGRHMRGGRITVTGDAGDWVASGMIAGRIDISGDAGDYVGAAAPDERFGMADGLVTIWGSAGDRIGDRMRRGQILIRNDTGDYTGSRMIAGTILVLGRSGRYTGYRMKRGTIILRSSLLHIPPGFRSCGILKMEFLRLLFRQSAKMGRRFAFFREFGPEVHRYAGDLSCDGKGEIFELQNARM
jgi:formylmethanofuran dehydrogenase subunit C